MYALRQGVHRRSTLAVGSRQRRVGLPTARIRSASSHMHSLDGVPGLTPLQRVVFETDQLDLTLRDSIKLATARMGYFVGQHKYLDEREKIARLIEANAAEPVAPNT